MDQLTTDEVGAKFAELICADDQWLRDEFSALMTANFSAPPAWPRPPAPPTFPPGGHSRRLPAGGYARQAGIRPAAAWPRPKPRGLKNQRSPPP